MQEVGLESLFPKCYFLYVGYISPSHRALDAQAYLCPLRLLLTCSASLGKGQVYVKADPIAEDSVI